MAEIILEVDGMMCGMCESHVQDALRTIDGVKKAKASHTKGTVEITADRDIPLHEFKHALKSTGYEVKGLSAAEPKKKGLFGGLFK